MRKNTIIILGLAALAIPALSYCKTKQTGSTGSAATPPNVVKFMKPALYPEGVEYDAKRKRFLVTSLREGVIGAVQDDGTYSVFIKNPRMVSAIGIRVDAARDRLFVCNSDPGASVHTNKKTQGKLAGLAVFQLSSGKLIQYIDLGALSKGGGHFCNDIALDGAGNAYVTDSFSPIIYKVTLDYKASVLLRNDRFKGKGFNLNGIVYRDGYLIVAKMNEGLLFKVPVNSPGKFTQVKTEPLLGADGLLWGPGGSLIVIANGTTNTVFQLASSDNWASAKVAGRSATGPVFATTGVLREGSVYVLDAMLHVLFNPKTKTHVKTFEIRKHTFQ